MRPGVCVVLAGLTLLLIGAFVAGCRGTTIKIGWTGSDRPGGTQATYATFDGVERKTLRARSGQAIALEGAVAVDKGTLTIQLVSPDGAMLWEEIFREDDALAVDLQAPEGGRYAVRIRGAETGGSFDISWRVGEREE